jgi:hypothetical protein
MPSLRTPRATRLRAGVGSRQWVQRGALGALLLSTALAAAACGGSSGSASSTSSTPATTSTTASGAASGATSAALAKYTACLKQNGVTLPTGGGSPPAGAGGAGGTPPAAPTGTNGGTSTTKRPTFPQGGNAKFAKAQAACAKLRPAGLRAGRPAGATTSSAAFAAYRNCLTLHGVKATALRGGANATPTAATEKAMTACASLRPKQQAPAGAAGSS